MADHGLLTDGPTDGSSLPMLPVGTALVTPDNLPPDPRYAETASDSMSAPALPNNARICIVGAGVAGLYIAMILDSLEIPGLMYDILEASERIGGRAYTHYFSDKKHDYYDIGAMRFRQIKIMDRTFKLFEMLQLPMIDYYLDTGTKDCPSRYNDIKFDGNTPKGEDVFKVGVKSGGSVPDPTVKKGKRNTRCMRSRVLRSQLTLSCGVSQA